MELAHMESISNPFKSTRFRNLSHMDSLISNEIIGKVGMISRTLYG